VEPHIKRRDGHPTYSTQREFAEEEFAAACPP
jgi:hypothetical protein